MVDTKNARLRTRCLSALGNLSGLEAVCVNVHVNVYLFRKEAEQLARESLNSVDLEGETAEFHVNTPLTCEEVVAFWKTWGGQYPDPNLAERMHAHVCVTCTPCWDTLVKTNGGALALAVGASKVVMLTWNSLGKRLI